MSSHGFVGTTARQYFARICLILAIAAIGVVAMIICGLIYGWKFALAALGVTIVIELIALINVAMWVKNKAFAVGNAASQAFPAPPTGMRQFDRPSTHDWTNGGDHFQERGTNPW